MKSLDCNQIKIFINLKITEEKDKYKKLCNLVQPLGATTASKPNFYYIVYNTLTTIAK